MGENTKFLIERLVHPEVYEHQPETIRFSMSMDKILHRQVNFLAKRFGTNKTALMNEVISAFVGDVYKELKGNLTEDEEKEFVQLFIEPGPLNYEEAAAEQEEGVAGE